MVGDSRHPPEKHVLHKRDQETRGCALLSLESLRVALQNRNGDLSGWPLFLFQAIHELYRGEQDLIEDLQLARKVRTCCFFPPDIERNMNIYSHILPLLLSQLQGIP